MIGIANGYLRCSKEEIGRFREVGKVIRGERNTKRVLKVLGAFVDGRERKTSGSKGGGMDGKIEGVLEEDR